MMEEASVAIAEIMSLLHEGGWEGDDPVAGVRGLIAYAEQLRLAPQHVDALSEPPTHSQEAQA